jgi:hypothetical protein
MSETTKLIEQIANKLGTTTEYLWGVLVKQAPIQSTITLFQIALVCVFGHILFKIHKRLMQEKKYGWVMESGYEQFSTAIPLMSIAFIIFLFFGISAFFCIADVFNGYFNPEYWALQQILNLIK